MKNLSIKKHICILLAVLLIFSIAPAAFAASSAEIQQEIDGLNSQKSDLESRMDALRTQIGGLDYEKANAQEKKAILDRKNDLAQQELDVIAEQIAIVDGMIASVQTDLAQAREDAAYQRERWLTRLRAMEESSGVDYMEVLFDAATFSDLLTRMDLVNEVMAYDEQVASDYMAALERVEALESQAETMYGENEARRQELETKQAQLEADIEAACAIIADMEASLEGYETVLEADAETIAAIEALIAEKQAELEKAKAAEDKARPGAIGGTGFVWPSYTRSLTDEYGWRLHPIQQTWRFHDGVDIRANYGTAIWSAQGGTVILAGWNGGYGKCVMVMHENGYTTLYGHMSTIAVSYGQTVSQGQVLGYVGSTGNSTGPHLHFEIRDNANPSTTYDPESFIYY